MQNILQPVPPQIIRKYGWKKDKEDPRDHIQTFCVSRNQSAIKIVDLRSQCPPIYDQGTLGSCTANAIAAAYEFDAMKEKQVDIFTPSRLFIYYNERVMEGTIFEDAGAEIRDGIKSINAIGVCPEKMWEYNILKFSEKPPQETYDNASHHKCVQYKRIASTLPQMKQCLIEGYPFVFGMQIYESFENENVAQTGKVPIPSRSEQNLGGHAVVCVGFNDKKRVFIIRNSWGESWGLKGYFYLPYEYMTNPNLTSDFWTIRQVIDTEPCHEQPKVPVEEIKEEPKKVDVVQLEQTQPQLLNIKKAFEEFRNKINKQKKM